jgi:hypothetical protein
MTFLQLFSSEFQTLIRIDEFFYFIATDDWISPSTSMGSKLDASLIHSAKYFGMEQIYLISIRFVS